MKQIKLYDVAFPIWIVMFFPPMLFITLAGNFIIDSLVILICFFIFKLKEIQSALKIFYMESILKVWLFGLLSDIVAAVILFLTGSHGDSFGLPNKIRSAIIHDPFSNPGAVIILIFSMLVSGVFMFLFNYRIIFKNQIAEKKLRFKVALTIAIVTIPWPFWFPAIWFYQGL